MIEGERGGVGKMKKENCIRTSTKVVREGMHARGALFMASEGVNTKVHDREKERKREGVTEGERRG